MRRTLKFLTALGLGLTLLFGGSAGAADSILWSNDSTNTLGIAALGGGGGGQLGGTIADEPYGTAFDSATGRVYLANAGTDSIVWIDLATHATGTLNTAGSGIDGPEGLSIDPGRRRVYWANVNSDTISWAALDGSGGGVLDTAGAPIEEPAGVTVYPAEGRIYWTSYGDSLIGWASLDGVGAGELEISTGFMEGPVGLMINAARGTIYWNNWDTGTIGDGVLTGPTSGGRWHPEAVELPGAAGLAYDPETEEVYWANETGFIAIAPLDLISAATEFDTTGATLGEPAFPILLKAPVAASTPTLAEVGTELECGSAWKPDMVEAFFYRAPQEVTYSWKLDGEPVAGATAATLEPARGGTYECEATGVDAVGSTSVSSPALAITVGGPPEGPTGGGQSTSPGSPGKAVAPGVSTAIRVAKVKIDRRHGVAGVFVDVSAAGTVRLAGKGVIGRRASASGAGRVRLSVEATGATLRELIEKGTAKVGVELTFAASDGSTATTRRTIALVRRIHGTAPEHRHHQR